MCTLFKFLLFLCFLIFNIYLPASSCVVDRVVLLSDLDLWKAPGVLKMQWDDNYLSRVLFEILTTSPTTLNIQKHSGPGRHLPGTRLNSHHWSSLLFCSNTSWLEFHPMACDWHPSSSICQSISCNYELLMIEYFGLLLFYL